MDLKTFEKLKDEYAGALAKYNAIDCCARQCELNAQMYQLQEAFMKPIREEVAKKSKGLRFAAAGVEERVLASVKSWLGLEWSGLASASYKTQEEIFAYIDRCISDEDYDYSM